MILDNSEQTVAFLGVSVVACGALYLFYRWVAASPRTPDPWGPEVENAVEGETAVPLCPHCLAPQEHNGWFCPECGSTSGQYGNYLPSVYMFSIGDLVRSGVQQRNPWTPLITVGYVLVAFCFLSVLAPIYCLLLLANRNQAKAEAGQPTPA